MESSFLSKLHIAIKEDDVKAFDKLITQKLLALCLGRFPLLSLCYMYQSTLILSKYEEQLLAINSANYINDTEPISIYADFKEKAGKSLRLFSVGTVSPAEMLAIMGLSEKLNYEWKNLEKNPQIIANVKKIYQINYGLECSADEDSISAPKIKGKAHSSDILLKFFIVTMCFVFLFSGILGVTLGLFGAGSKSIPLKVNSLDIFKENIANAVALEKDMDLSGLTFEKVGTIKGNNKKIIVDRLNIFDKLDGELSDLTIEINLDIRIIEVENALIKVNNGTIKNVTVIVNGKITEENLTGDLLVSTLVGTNNGTIENTKVKGDITIVGNAKGNASFAAFACVNNGLIKDCELLDGSIKGESVDLAGFAIENNGEIENVRNSALISQKTSSEAWSPNCAGIVFTNNGNVINTENKGKIQGSSEALDFAQIILGGIVVNNYGTIENSTNNGELEATSENCYAYVGGIASYNYAKFSEVENLIKPSFINGCVNNGNISVSNTCVEKSNYLVVLLAGGIVAQNQGNVSQSDNYGKITAHAKTAYVCLAGIVADNRFFQTQKEIFYAKVNECKSETNIEADLETMPDVNIGISLDKETREWRFFNRSLFGGIVAQNQGMVSKCFAFNTFSISAPQIESERNGDSEDENETILIPSYFVGSVAGFNLGELLPNFVYQLLMEKNFGYYPSENFDAIGIFFAHQGTGYGEVNIRGSSNENFVDKDEMIKMLKKEGIYR